MERPGTVTSRRDAVQFGFHLPSRGALARPALLLRLARRAEALGYDLVTVSDHVVLPTRHSAPYPYHPEGEFPGGAHQDYLEPLALLGWLLGATRRLGVGTSVLVVPYRNPVVTAKQLAVLDVLSAGRLIVGCGVGWWPEEFEALQAPPFARRGAVTDEYLRLWVALWSEDPVTFDGRYYRVRDVTLRPKPVQRPHPPLWIGGHTPAALRRAGTLGDGWHPIGLRPPALLTPEEYARAAGEVRDHAARAGRDPDRVRLTFRAPLDLWPSGRRPPGAEDGLLRGPAAKVVEELRAYQRAGVRTFVFDFARPEPRAMLETMTRFARQVRPRVARPPK